LTNNIDVILQDTNGAPRTLMTCGHAVSANSLYQYVKSEFTKQYIYDICCPDPKCKQVWSWDLCCEIANFNINECQVFETYRMDRQKNLKKMSWL